MTRILQISLSTYRNYRAARLEPHPRCSVIVGPNGSGKTNLLEAISLLAPGRGLRAARLEAIAQQDGQGSFAVAARIEAADGVHDLGTGTTAEEAGRRQFRLDGQPVRSQAEIAALFGVVWLTPQMDRLFGDAPAGRRRFLDRLALALDPAHVRTILAHERALATRRRLLAERPGETAWIEAAEDQLARHAVAATATRLSLCHRLNALGTSEGGFPRARLRLVDPIAERLEGEPARRCEDWLRERLAASRAADRASGATSHGAHRTDVGIEERATGLAASRASTGQQKALLLGIVLAHAGLIAAERGMPPVLLLDEPLVHLDPDRRAALFERLATTGSQLFLTGTDLELFEHAGGPFGRFRTDGASILPIDG